MKTFLIFRLIGGHSGRRKELYHLMAAVSDSEHAKECCRSRLPVQVAGRRLLRFASRFTVQIALLLLITAFSILSPDFLQPGNWSNIIQQSSIIAIAACGATLVIITAGIDLSVGSVVALAGICSAGSCHQSTLARAGRVVCLHCRRSLDRCFQWFLHFASWPVGVHCDAYRPWPWAGA